MLILARIRRRVRRVWDWLAPRMPTFMSLMVVGALLGAYTEDDPAAANKFILYAITFQLFNIEWRLFKGRMMK